MGKRAGQAPLALDYDFLGATFCPMTAIVNTGGRRCQASAGACVADATRGVAAPPFACLGRCVRGMGQSGPRIPASPHPASTEKTHITMSTFQQGILAPLPSANRYLSFQTARAEDVVRALGALREAIDTAHTVVGFGPSLAQGLDRKIDGLKPFPDMSKPGAPVPSTQAALWIWLRGEDHGEITLRSRAIEKLLAPAFVLDSAANAFRYADDRDLSGYEDGTENPEDEEAAETAFVSGKGPGLDGASFVAVQQWVHDFPSMEAIPGEEMDRIVGRRKSDNEELEDAPAYAHVKRTEQESFTPEAKVLRRSAPWADERRAGLYFVAFGHSLRAFEVQMRRMVGATDGVLDGLFRFTQPITGAFFWCPPAGEDGKPDLSALGI